MKFVCIMGNSEFKKEKLAVYLEKIGFKRNKKITTDFKFVGSNDYKVVSNEKMQLLIDGNKLINCKIEDNLYYASQKPFGATRYTEKVDENTLEDFKSIYKDQIISVYIKDTESDICDKADIIVESYENVNNAIAYILKAIKEREELI